MFTSTRIYIYIAVAVFLATAVGGAYWYYQDTQDKLQEQAAMLAGQQIVLRQQSEIIIQKAADAKQQAVISKTINLEFARTRKDLDVLRNKFNKISASGATRDLGKIAIVRPKSIRRVINNGTREALRCIEIASGSPLTDKEVNATKKSEINDHCPEIANPNYISH